MNPLDEVFQLNRVSRGDPRVTVAILDGPVDLAHKTLAGADLLDLTSDPKIHSRSQTAAFHGTHVCSIIFGQGVGGVRGIAPECRGIVIPIFRDGLEPGTIAPCSQLELAIAIDRAVSYGANIINISGGQYSRNGTIHPILQRTLDTAHASGVLVISATGNDSCRCHHIPSADPTVLAVGAHDQAGVALETSNWGERYRNNGVVAFGQNVLGAVPGGTRQGTGTSFATPVVAGVAALLMSHQLNVGGSIDGAGIHQAIIASAERCFESTETCQRMLAGKLNPIGALKLLLEESLTSKETERNTIMSYPTNNPPQLNPSHQLSPSQNLVPPVPEVIMPSGHQYGEVGDVASAPAVTNPKASVSAPAASVGQPHYQVESPQGGLIPSNNATAPMMDAVQQEESSAQCGVQPSGRGYESGANGSLVYVIGEIGFDYGTEARRDSITSHIIAAGFGDIHPQEQERLAKYLAKNPWDAESVIWTISLNNVPIYAVRPNGPYAAEAYKLLVEFLDDNHKKGPNRSSNHVAIPGRIVGSARLLQTGQTVPVVQPEIRGMANWSTKELVDSTLKGGEKKDKDLVNSLNKILEKIYHEHQNLGILPQDRAINYAASNTTEIKRMIMEAKSNDSGRMFFDNIECEPSPICRPGSECWIIKINFFVHDQTDRSRRMYRFTVDVSDVVPVSLSDMQDWYVR